MGKSKRTRLGMKISALTVLSAAGAILLLGAALILMFAIFFSQNTREDIEYYLDNTNQQFTGKVQFLQDSAIAIRHNTIMEEFFSRNHFNEEEVETQLAYCMDLFSDRNLVDQNAPFAVSVYLFNNKGDFVRKRYYPTTLSAMERADEKHRSLQQVFRDSREQFQCHLDEGLANLCFRLYDDAMREMGVCVVAIQLDAIRAIFDEGGRYEDLAWSVTAGDSLVVGGGDGEAVAALSQTPRNFLGSLSLEGRAVLCSARDSGFGLRAAIAVDRSSVYAVLLPTIQTFVLVLILVLALVTVILYVVSYRSVRPLKEMAEEIDAFGEGDLTVRMKDFSEQEFHDISAVFNEMADRIDHLITQVYEKELLAARAQVKYLQAQINPHFQFNILAMLSVKAKLAGNEELYQSLQAFSKLIQGKIFREREIKIPLSEELELVNFYLLLQKGRYQDKLSYEIHCDREAKDCLIPRLLIEPLVENAVSHGLEPKGEAGKVEVRIFEEGERLHIIVEDDGVGYDGEDGSPLPELEGHTSTGLSNTRRLLQILYDQCYRMTIRGKKGLGTRVEVVLPVEREVRDAKSYGG